MTINITNYPLNNATRINKSLAQTIANAITIILNTNSGPFNNQSFQVSINSTLAIAGGTSQPGRFIASFTSITPTSRELQIIFHNSSDSFEDYEGVYILIEAKDSSSSFSETIFFRMQDTISPTLDGYAPLSNSTDNPTNTPAVLTINDQGSGVNPSSLNVSINVETSNVIHSYNAILGGVFQSGFTGTLLPTTSSLQVLISKTNGYHSDSNIQITGYVEDQEQNPLTIDFSFNIIDVSPPSFSTLIPAPNELGVPQNSTIAMQVTDEYSSGLDLTSLNVLVNNKQAVMNGALQGDVVDLNNSQLSIIYFTHKPQIEKIYLILKPLYQLPSATKTSVKASINDNSQNNTTKQYSFTVRDYRAPWIENNTPADGYANILPTSTIEFDLVDDRDGYGVDFTTLQIQVNGYSTLNETLNNIPVDGYFDGYLGLTFSALALFETKKYQTPVVHNQNKQITYPGFLVITTRSDYNRVHFQINSSTQFDLNSTVYYQVHASDRGGNSNSYTFSFTTANKESLITTAFPNTGTFKNFLDGYDGYSTKQSYDFLYSTGVVLTTNFPNTLTFYTTDGTTPRINQHLQVVGTTKIYTKPILFNKEGLNVLKFFSTDEAGNTEQLRQETYMIAPLPADVSTIISIAIISDLPLPVNIIPVESTALFKQNQMIVVLDDKRPPINTKILAVNSTSSPQYIIVQDAVDRLKVSRNARIQLAKPTINTAAAISFDTTQLNEYMYIGSDIYGKNNADAVFEQFRILNKASSDEDILADYIILSQGTKFFNQTTAPSLPSSFSTLEQTRVNLPDNTLVLLNFDGNTENATRQLSLANSTIQVVDIRAASNDLIFTIKILNNEYVDKELLTSVLTNFAPADFNVVVRYEEAL